MVDVQKTRVPIATLAFAVFAVLVMLISIFGVGIFFTPDPARGAENAFPHSPDGIPGSVQIKFLESGLTPGTSWSVTLTYGSTHSTLSSTASDIIFNAAKNTQYSYAVSTVFGTTPSPSSGSLNSGYGVTVDVTYNPPYLVEFTEQSNFALPSGMQWSAKLGSNTYSATGTSISVGVSDGSFSYTFNSVTNYTQSPSFGSVTVNGASESVLVSFYNYSIAANQVAQLSSYLHPNWDNSSITVSTMTIVNGSSVEIVNSTGTEVVSNAHYDYVLNSSLTNLTLGADIQSKLSLQNTTDFKTYDEYIRSFDNFTLSSEDNISNVTVYVTNDTYENSNMRLLDSNQTAYFTNATFYAVDGVINDSVSFSTPNGTGSGSMNLTDPSTNSTVHITSGYITGIMMNDTAPVNYTLAISDNNVTVNAAGDPIVIGDGFDLSTKRLGSYGWASLATITESFGLTKQEFAGSTGFVTGMITILLLIDTEAETANVAASVFFAIGVSIGTSNPVFLAVIAVITGFLAYELTLTIENHFDITLGGTFYSQIGLDVRSIPSWEFWAWPPKVGAYGEVGAYDGTYYWPLLTTELFTNWGSRHYHQGVWNENAEPPWP